MHITVGVFTNTPAVQELEDLLSPFLYGDPYADCRPTRAQLEAWGILAPGEPWEEENHDPQIDSWDLEKPPVPAPEVPKEAIPYAFVTLDGVWESNEAFPSAEAWTAYWEAALARNTKAYVTYCDCHV